MDGTLVMRSDKVAFYEVEGDSIYRMTGFTDATTTRNPAEYERKYIDETVQTSSVTGYSPSMSYTFDQYVGNEVHDDIIDITENEKVGSDAVRRIYLVDMNTDGATAGSKVVRARDFAVVPDSDGSGTDGYQYVGNFKAAGSVIVGEATTTDDWETITFTQS